MTDGVTKARLAVPSPSREQQVRSLPRHSIRVLSDSSVVLLVRSGAAEVFSSQVENGIPVGRRRFLFRARARDLIFSLAAGDSPDTQLVMMPQDEMNVLQVRVDQIEHVLRAEGIPPVDAIENWVNCITSFFSRSGIPAAAEEISGSRETRMDSGQHVFSGRNNFTWVRVLEGRASLLGLPELAVEADGLWLPLGNSLWLRAETQLTLRSQTTHDILSKPEILPSLLALHSLVSRRIATLDVEDSEKELVRLEERGLLQRRLTTSALQAVVSVLDPQPIIPLRETPLLTVAAAVGAAMGIEIRAPLRSENMDRVKDPIEAIARASQLRHRRVLLRGEWWKADCGPLVGYRKQSRAPVALLRHRRDGYRIVDPETKERVPVNHQTARSLEPEAAMLYASLPDEVKTPWDLLRFALRDRSVDAVFVVTLSLVMTLTGMLIPIAMAMVMDKAIPDSDRRLLVELGLALVASSVGAALFGFSRGIVTIRAAITLDARAESALWDRLLKLRPSFFKRYASGDLLSRLTAVTDINRTLNGAVLQSVLSSTMALLSLALLFYYSAQLALIAVGVAIVTAAVTFASGYLIRRYSVKEVEIGGSIFGLVVQMANAVGKIRVAGAEERAFALWLKKYSAQLNLTRKSQATQDYVTVFNQIVPAISSVLLFWTAVDLLPGTRPSALAEGGIGVGVFLAFNTALATFISGATTLSNMIVDVMDTLAKSERIVPILAAEKEISSSKSDPGTLEGSITLSHVDFRYSGAGPKVLDDLSLRVSPGEFVALAGPSGSGKSTILRLLLGFEIPGSGTVLYDDQDLAGLDITAVRRQLGVVLQSGFLSAGSILDNIAGGTLVSVEEAWAAAADAALADDIKQMPMGLHTMISEGATNLSGGQRQRLLIARALVSRPTILLLDEATSALDNRTQAIVSDGLRRRRVTRIVIAHRLSTIKSADRIVVLDRGRIVEVGTFEQLIEQNGLFASMVARQTV